MKIIVEATCDAATSLSSGIDKSLLRVDPTSPLNGEHVTVSLRRSRGEIDRGKRYRVTIEEIDDRPVDL